MLGQQELVAEIEANLALHSTWLQARTPRMWARSTTEIAISDCGLDDDNFNIVAYARLSEVDTEDLVRRTIDEVRATGRTFAWLVGPASRPVDLSARLTEHGFGVAATETVMWAPATPPPPARTAARFVVADRPERIADVGKVIGEHWNPDAAETVAAFFAAVAPAALRPESPIRHVIAYLDDEPVACAELTVRGKTAGIYNVCTHRSHRGNGFGTAVTAEVMRLAVDAGCENLGLQATELGRPVYEKLGFTALGEHREHTITATPVRQ